MWEGRGGGLTQSEINNSTLIHHKLVITARTPVAKAFHSAWLQKVGGGLLASILWSVWGINIFRLVLHSISVSFWSAFKFIFNMHWEFMVIQRSSGGCTGFQWIWDTGVECRTGSEEEGAFQLQLAMMTPGWSSYTVQLYVYTHPKTGWKADHMLADQRKQ